MTFDIFANDGLLVMARDVVPFDSVSVKVVEHGHARFGIAVLLNLFAVVGLGARRGESEAKIKR